MFHSLRRVLPCAGLVLLSLPAFARQTPASSGPRVIPVPLDFSKFTKSKLYLMRGERLCFTGDTANYGGLTVTVRAGGNPVASGNYEEKCALVWDSAREHYAGRLLWLYVKRGNSAEAAIAQVDVTILDKPPFDFSAAPVPDTEGHFAFAVKMIPDALGGVETDSYDLFYDDKPTGIAAPATGTGEMDLTTLPPGKHLFCLKAHLHDGGELEAGRFTYTVHARVALALDIPSDVVDLRQGSPLLRLHATPDGDVVPASAEYILDGQTLATKSANVIALTLDLSHSRSGAHRVAVVMVTKTGQRYQSVEIPFRVLRDTATDYRLWKEAFSAYCDRQSADSRTLTRYMKTNFEGRKQTQLAIDTIQAMLLRNETAAPNIANMDWPAALEQEDQRTLETARRELIASFNVMQDVSRKLQGKLNTLLRYDGTLAAAPADFRWDLFTSDQYSTGLRYQLNAASNTADHCARNLELVERRGNLK